NERYQPSLKSASGQPGVGVRVPPALPTQPWKYLHSVRPGNTRTFSLGASLYPLDDESRHNPLTSNIGAKLGELVDDEVIGTPPPGRQIGSREGGGLKPNGKETPQEPLGLRIQPA